eukprot:TRINITY_DN12177_c0_g1_i1.p1 TRINITY_DN12177_c0_g1~~TRINITY_DN12177_c0_g1_i1.p1  ORF type:complete len:428 (-),score=100.40 TRINITY_DN12177_c0_g1_i1:128-1387(-)
MTARLLKFCLLLSLIFSATLIQAQEDECKDGACGPRELKLPHDEDETENPNNPSSINLLQIEKSGMGSVIAYEDFDRKVKMLMSSRFGVGGHYANDKFQHYMPVHAIMEAVKFAWKRNPESALILGTGGAGNMYHFLKKSGVESIKIVEQDYQVNQIAKKHFGLEEAASNTEYKGARAWLNENDKKDEFDLIIHDAFSLGYRPVDSLSRLAIKKLDSILSDDGMLVIKWYGHVFGPHRKYTLDLLKTLKAVFPSVRLFADRKPSWSSPKPFAHLAFFCSKTSQKDGGIEFKLPEKVTKAEDPTRGKKIHTWKHFQEWEQLYEAADIDAANIVSEKDNVLIKWYKKTARDFKGDMRYKVPLRVWNLAHDYLKMGKDNPFEDDDDDDNDGYDVSGEGAGDPRFKNVSPDVLKKLKEMGAKF